MQIAMAQIPCALGDKKENLERMKSVVEAGQSDLYVFSELFLTGYMIRDEVHRLAEAIDGPSIQAVQNIAAEHGAHILFGMPTWDAELPAVLRNSAVMVSPNGEVNRYDKVDPATFGPFEEGLYFGAGQDGLLVEIQGRKIGVMICYDLFFSELARSYALAGAEALVCISASPFTSRESFERLVPARAVENAMYSIYVNQTGTQLNQVFFGGSMAYGPRGELLAKCKYFDKDLAVAKLCTYDLRAARRLRPTVRDAKLC
jgi:predicted amidohydrolase